MPPKKRGGRGGARSRAKKVEDPIEEKTEEVLEEKEEEPKTVPSKRPRRGAKVVEPESENEVLDVKKSKAEEESEEESLKNDMKSKLIAADKKNKIPKVHAPDKLIPNASSYTVHEDYDCMLNQTNIGHNNNKFYVIQVLKNSYGHYTSWNRWGRVGENGQSQLGASHTDVNKAIKDFEKKFKDKTKNDWSNRANFKPVSGKYTLIEMDGGDEAEVEVQKTDPSIKSGDYQPSKLDIQTQNLIGLIFDTNMFKDAMKSFDIDVKKMPLGKLSKTQIAKGFEVLEEIEEVLKTSRPSNAKLMELSSKFYTVIPQDFGRQRPHAIDDSESLQKKYDMLTVLGDIELAQSMQEKKKEPEIEIDLNKPPHPYDVNYELLKCKLTLVDKKSDEFKIIDTYTKNTGGGWRRAEILDVWRVERENEDVRFSMYKNIDNRKLLWHGTNVAVVVAILKTGLRIMPHSGGRVGKGIYFASENAKSAGYVGTTSVGKDQIGIMFLNEVALGKEHHITRDDSSLIRPPKGYDSVVAQGNTEPDPKEDTHLMIDGNKVVVPQGKPISNVNGSSFAQSEYLIYDESQNRIRYLCKMKF
jgi:poly [ADP-ribose] polymerase 2/3/4